MGKLQYSFSRGLSGTFWYNAPVKTLFLLFAFICAPSLTGLSAKLEHHMKPLAVQRLDHIHKFALARQPVVILKHLAA